ncbi:uncharacterized protein [Coffea arabica]|uniref:Reverse transcriptase domain-containing protein n=1 Tax=Coffea arabica TaxID=13443 RepID=A0ABM4VUM3_COFAR
MRVLVWNCQDAGSPLTVPHLKEENRLLSSNIIFLSETKNRKNYMEKVKKILDFENSFIVEAMNRIGGMALLWNNEVKISEVLGTTFTIEAKVEDEEKKESWWFIGIYASCDGQIRRKQWEVLNRRKSLWGAKWIIMVDFNDITSNDEKWGGRVTDNGSFQDFKNFINDNQLVDVGYEGKPWTWSNNWYGPGVVKERLDRGLCTLEWSKCYEEANCTHIESQASDHSMLLLETQKDRKQRRKRFQFDKRWLQQSEVDEVVKKAWDIPCTGTRWFKVKEKIKNCRIELLKWSSSKKGNSSEKIKWCKSQIEEIKASNGDNKKQQVQDMKGQLKKAYEEEEAFWNQKSRLRWLKEGDKNTQFFHATVKGRRKRNRLQKLRKESGEWTTNDEELGGEIAKYYVDLFKSTANGQLEEILTGIPITITEHMNKDLTKKVDEIEIKNAFFSMDPNKAPGNDGMSPLFFQKFWSLIKKDLVNAIQGFFHHGVILKAINHTVISLIPKVDCPTEINQYRPISLCQVVYKALAKILVNRLKPFLSRCISKSQSAFVPGRQILDNVILSHELMHYLKNKRQGSVGSMAVKLDMSKAYDRVEWSFLKAIMEKMGFCSTWVNWIMACISTVTYSFNINGEHKEFVTPSRGIRQGDPLSPYLFLLCSEGLSSLLQKAKIDKELTGIKICRKAPTITHLFFADDSLVFCKANKQEAEKLKRILKVYEEATGQLINMDKSSVLFSKNTLPSVKSEVCQAMGSIKQVEQGKYLGLPMAITRSKEQVFGFVRNSIDKKLKGWRNKLLSQAGKEIMIKAVAMAMPTYTMSCFRLTNKMCKEISSKMADYWWGDADGKKKLHWISWKKLTAKRSNGGMGFKDLKLFNKALLAKQIWKIITQPNLLVSRVLKEKYYPKQSLFNGKVPQNASWIWQSLAGVRKELQEGIRRKIGNGRGTRIWEDNWIPGTVEGKPTTTRPLGCQLTLVSDLIRHNRWNRVLVFKTFNSQDAERILSIPLSVTGCEDSYFWMHSQAGQYTVHSGYKAWLKAEENKYTRRKEDAGTSFEGTNSKIWNSLWQQKVSQKLKVFIWKCLHGGLPVKEAIFSRTKLGNPICTGCGEKVETIEHMLLQCAKVKEIWKMAPVQWDGIEHLSDNFTKWWSAIQEAQASRGVEDQVNITINILWQIWKSRNNREFNYKEKVPFKIIEKAQQEWSEYNEANKGENSRRSTQGTAIQQRTVQVQHESHTGISLKIHTHQDRRQAAVGIGITAIDNLGQLQAAWALRERSSGDTLQDQAVAVRLALLKVAGQGWRNVKVELDNRKLVETITAATYNNQMMATLIEDIRSIGTLFQQCSILFANSRKIGSIKLSIHALNIWVDEEWVNPNFRC